MTPTPHFCLSCWWGRGQLLPNPWFFSWFCLSNLYAPERSMALLCILSGLEVCSHVVLRVNDLRISAIIPKSKNCCPTLQGRHAERVYYPPALTLPNIFRRGKGNFWSLQLGLIGPGHLGQDNKSCEPASVWCGQVPVQMSFLNILQEQGSLLPLWGGTLMCGVFKIFLMWINFKVY